MTENNRFDNSRLQKNEPQEVFESKLINNFDNASRSIVPEANFSDLVDSINNKKKTGAAKPSVFNFIKEAFSNKKQFILTAGVAAVALFSIFTFQQNFDDEKTITAEPEQTEFAVQKDVILDTTLPADVENTETTTEAASTETSSETTATSETSTAPSTTSNSESTQTTDQGETPETGNFFEDFAGPSALSRFDNQIIHSNDFAPAQQEWPQDSCGGAAQETIERGLRSENFNSDWLFRCAATGRLFTTIGDTAGYSIGAVTPKQTFTNISEIKWDASIAELGNRQWTEVAVVPISKWDITKTPCTITWMPCENSHNEIDSVGVSFFNKDLHINLGSGEVEGPKSWYSLNPGDSAIDPVTPGIEPELRSHYFRQETNNGQTQLVYGIEAPDGSFEELRVDGSFPSGEVKVVFSDHNFTPLKAENGTPETFTWYWDNISIS